MEIIKIDHRKAQEVQMEIQRSRDWWKAFIDANRCPPMDRPEVLAMVEKRDKALSDLQAEINKIEVEVPESVKAYLEKEEIKEPAPPEVKPEEEIIIKK